MPRFDEIDGPRPCRPEELPELLELVNYVFRTSQGRPPDIADAYRHIYTEDNLERVFVIGIDGAIRASVGLYPFDLAAGEHSINALGLNCTTCHPDWRRHGLGARLMNEATRLAERDDLDLIHLDAGVPDWYRKFDYEQAGSRYLYHLDRGNVELLPPLNCGVVTDLERHVEQLHALYHAQRSGNMRPLHNSRESYARYPGQLLAAQIDGELQAYIYANADGDVIECAGEPADLIAGLTRELFYRLDHEKEGASTTTRDERDRPLRGVDVALEVSPVRADLIELLDAMAIPRERRYWHMARLTDPPALAAKLGFEGTVEPAAEGYLVTTDRGEQTMTRGAVGRLLFGPERHPLRTRDPVPLFAPGTDHV